MNKTRTRLTMTKANELKVFIGRLNRIGVKMEVSLNLPWVYIEKVNGNQVKEKGNGGNHGFTVAWHTNDGIRMHKNMSQVFELLRRYK